MAKDAHLAARELLRRRRASPTANASRLPGSPFRSDRGRGARGPAPELGADDGILGDAGRPGARPPGAATDGADHRQPLAGIRIVDFSWAIAGPFATRLLADLGADVIKIESEHRLDPIRHIGPQPTDVVSLDTNGVFQDCRRRQAGGHDQRRHRRGAGARAPADPTADVVTANFTPDRLDRWGFDRDDAGGAATRG